MIGEERRNDRVPEEHVRHISCLIDSESQINFWETEHRCIRYTQMHANMILNTVHKVDFIMDIF